MSRVLIVLANDDAAYFERRILNKKKCRQPDCLKHARSLSLSNSGDMDQNTEITRAACLTRPISSDAPYARLSGTQTSRCILQKSHRCPNLDTASGRLVIPIPAAAIPEGHLKPQPAEQRRKRSLQGARSKRFRLAPEVLRRPSNTELR